jgi:hypothetical protein
MTRSPAIPTRTLQRRASVARDHLVDQPIRERLLGLEEAIALHVAVDLLDRPAGVVGIDMRDPLARLYDLARVNLDVGRHPLEPGGGLVDENATVGQRRALALAPPASSTEPIDSATPQQIVNTSGLKRRAKWMRAHRWGESRNLGPHSRTRPSN